MLQGAPWLLSHRSMLKPHQPMKISLYGDDYVLWQDDLGKISCLPNACPHMGAMLSAGWCVTKPDGSSTVACPFHALEFDSAGCTILPGAKQPTKSLIEPLELIVQGDFIWTYGRHEPKIPVPSVLNQIAAEYELIGYTGEVSVKTDLLTMLLNMHDYNHQNGTHRPLFEIEEVQFQQFCDRGHHSHAYFNMPRTKPKLRDILKNPTLLVLPKILRVHLENCFPSFVIVHAESPIASIRECHLFVPEAPNMTRTYVLMFGQIHNPLAHLIKRNFLRLADVVVKQDADILTKLYTNTHASSTPLATTEGTPRQLSQRGKPPHEKSGSATNPLLNGGRERTRKAALQHIKLNNEVGMDWVRRNFANFPNVGEPNLSR